MGGNNKEESQEWLMCLDIPSTLTARKLATMLALAKEVGLDMGKVREVVQDKFNPSRIRR